MGLYSLLKNQLGHGPKFQKLHMHSLSNTRQNWAIFALWAAVSEIMTDLQNCHIWPWNLAIGQKFQKWHMYSLFFNPGGRNWTHSRSTGSGFLAWIFGHEFQKLHICSLSTPRGRNWAYFCSTGRGFRDTGQFLILPYLGMKLGKWPKFQKLHIYPLSTPGGQLFF